MVLLCRVVDKGGKKKAFGEEEYRGLPGTGSAVCEDLHISMSSGLQAVLCVESTASGRGESIPTSPAG